MARRLVWLPVLATVLGLAASAWLGRASPVEAAPKTPPAAMTLPACKSELTRSQRELAAAVAAQQRAEAAEAEARAELEAMRAAERARIKRLEAQTGVAADKLR